MDAVNGSFAGAKTGLHFGHYRILLPLKYLHPCKQCTLHPLRSLQNCSCILDVPSIHGGHKKARPADVADRA